MAFLRMVENRIGERLRVIDIGNRQAAGLARRFDRQIADAEHALQDVLFDLHILHLRQLNRARGLRENSQLVAEAIAGNGHCSELPAQRPPQDRKQDQRSDPGQPEQPAHVAPIREIQYLNGEKHHCRDYQTDHDEFRGRTNRKIGHSEYIVSRESFHYDGQTGGAASMFRKVVTIVAIVLLTAATLPADFTYQETSTITGGAVASMMKLAGVFSKSAREPIQSTVSVKGDRMMHRSKDHASVIDLNSQTITSIDYQKKTYSTLTFEEMKQQLEQMQQKMKKNDKAEMSFKVQAKNTGNTKQINGLDCKEMILTMTMEGTDKESGKTGSMVVTTDMWIAPGAPGYQEVRNFYRRMAEKLAWTPGGNMFMSNPDAAKGMAEVYKEVAKLDGVPVQQNISMGVQGDATAAQSQPQQQQQQQAERPSLGGVLGGRFGLGKKKTSS